TVRPVGRHARALTGGVHARHHRAPRVDHALAVDVGGDAAHGVVGRGLDGDGRRLRLDGQVRAHEVGDVRELGVDLLGGQVGEVEVDGVLVGADAPAFEDLGLDGPGHHVGGGEVLHRGRVALHEALVRGVAGDAALA